MALRKVIPFIQRLRIVAILLDGGPSFVYVFAKNRIIASDERQVISNQRHARKFVLQAVFLPAFNCRRIRYRGLLSFRFLWNINCCFGCKKI
jgi:hypothetical protein